MAKKLDFVRPGRGRPRKFGRPSRTVALTLPEDVIAALSRVDGDLGRAVVRVTQPLMADLSRRPPAELSKHGQRAVIVIKPLPALHRIPGVTLVPLPDGRALISLAASMSVFEFELRLRDAIEEAQGQEKTELAAIGAILEAARRTHGVAMQQPSIIVLQSSRHRRIG